MLDMSGAKGTAMRRSRRNDADQRVGPARELHDRLGLATNEHVAVHVIAYLEVDASADPPSDDFLSERAVLSHMACTDHGRVVIATYDWSQRYEIDALAPDACIDMGAGTRRLIGLLHGAEPTRVVELAAGDRRIRLLVSESGAEALQREVRAHAA